MNYPDLFSKAEQALRSGRTEEALELLQPALVDKRHYLETRLTLAGLLLRHQEISAARKLLLEADSHTPDHPHNLALLAHVARREVRPGEARRYLQRAYQSAQATQDTLKFIASELVALGAYQKAIDTLKRVEPMDAQSFYHLGLSHFKLGEIGKALPIYRKLYARIPDSPLIARELSLAAAAFREYGTAVEAYTRYMQLSQPTATDYLKFSDLLLMNHSVDESERCLQQAIALGEDSAESRLLEAKLLRLKGDYQGALVKAHEVASVLLNSGTAWKIISELIEPEAIGADLIENLIKALALPIKDNQDRELTRFALAEFYTKQGNVKAAYQQMQAANLIKKQQLECQHEQYDREAIESQFAAIRKTFALPANLKFSRNSHRPIFIVGMPRSGTTVINRLLQASGKLQCIGESEAIPFIFSQLQHNYGGGQERFAPLLEEEKWEQLATDYLQRAGAEGKQLVDKMPHNFLYVGTILSMFPNAHIVQLRRNPFDVCMSIYAKPFPEGHDYACDTRDLAHFYWNASALMDFWSQTYSKQVIDLDFDAFLDNPSASGAQLFSTLGQDWQDNYLTPSQKATQSFTFSELQVRKPISKNEANKWQAFREVASDLIEAIRSEKFPTAN